MKIISIVLAFIAFGMCFIGWGIPVFGPILIAFCAVISIIVACMTYKKDNDKMLNILSIIISTISIILALIFIGLQIYVYTTSSGDINNSSEYEIETVLSEVTTVVVGEEFEIEDGLFITINNIYYDTSKESIMINYSVKNVKREDVYFYPNKLYYTNSSSIEPTYINSSSLEPIVIAGESNIVMQQSSIKLDDSIDSLGYTNSKDDSFEIPITTN